MNLIHQQYLGDGAYAYVCLENDKYDVYETAAYGGTGESYLDTFDTLTDAVTYIENLT